MTHGENKNVQRSIRLTDSAFSFIMSQPGDGFNEKLDKLLYRCFWHGKKLEHEVAQLEQHKAEIEAKIELENNVLNKLVILCYDARRLQDKIRALLEVNTDAIQ